jgi:hypothetical protein
MVRGYTRVMLQEPRSWYNLDNTYSATFLRISGVRVRHSLRIRGCMLKRACVATLGTTNSNVNKANAVLKESFMIVL